MNYAIILKSKLVLLSKKKAPVVILNLSKFV